MQVVLTQIEATGIQDYIFGSNNLKQNVGASELVARSTTEWVVVALTKCKFSHNGEWDGIDIRLNGRRISDPNTDAEIVYAGGGNALILFTAPDDPLAKAKAFMKELTLRALLEARGLSLVVAHSSAFEWETESLSRKHVNLRQEASLHKWSPTASLPMLGLGVTATCDFTGLPAIDVDDDGRLISAVAKHKLDAEKGREDSKESATARLGRVLKQVKEEGYEFVQDFDLFGERGDSRYIAVVHADGNGMGKRFDAIANAHPNPEDNDAYVLQLRALSDAIKAASSMALKSTVDLLLKSKKDEDDKFGGEVPVPTLKKGGREIRYLPFRPIVFGGDDVTFVCEGRLGLSLAAHFLQALLKSPLPGARDSRVGEPLYARAGIAIVKSHYPFSRAYQLAEELSKSAKKRLNDWDIKGAMLDWHISTSGAVLSLTEIRRREFTAETGNSLLMRPLLVARDNTVPVQSRFWRSWATFESLFKAFKTDWGDKRNKVKALRDALRQGSLAVEVFRSNYQQDMLPAINGVSTEAQLKGWFGTECGYFDVIEALDFHVPLAQGATTNGK